MTAPVDIGKLRALLGTDPVATACRLALDELGRRRLWQCHCAHQLRSIVKQMKQSREDLDTTVSSAEAVLWEWEGELG